MNPDALLTQLQDVQVGDVINGIAVIISEQCIDSPDLWYIQLDGFLWGGTVDYLIGYKLHSIELVRPREPTPEDLFRNAMALRGYTGTGIQGAMTDAAREAGLL